MRRPDLIAAGSGLLLIVSLLLTWYSRDTDVAGAVINQTWTAWQATPVISTLLFLIGAVAVACLAAPAGFRADRVLVPLGVLALLLVLFSAIDLPIEDVKPGEGDSVDDSRGLGLYLALLAGAGIVVGGASGQPERRRPLGRARDAAGGAVEGSGGQQRGRRL